MESKGNKMPIMVLVIVLFVLVILGFKMGLFSKKTNQKTGKEVVEATSVEQGSEEPPIEEPPTEEESTEAPTEPETEEEATTKEDTSSEETQEDPLGKQEDGSYVYNGHRYEIVAGDYTWDGAKKRAEILGGYLVTIQNEDEEEFLEEILEDSSLGLKVVWLGGNNLNGSYQWITGEENNYGKCHDGEPSGGKEHYLSLFWKDDQWGWNDLPNDVNEQYAGQIGFIAEHNME